MRIVKLTLPLDIYAKSLFKNTVGNDLKTTHGCKILKMAPKDSFTKSFKSGK
jgi:hypothetical protein